VGPTRIWLQPLTEDHRDGWTWCWHEIGEADAPDIAYVRVDVVDDLVLALRCAERLLDDFVLWAPLGIADLAIGRDDLRAALSRMEGTGQ
jgi:hypothetical protein